MKLRRLVAVTIGALGLSLGIAIPAQAAVHSIIDVPFDGQHVAQGQALSVQGTCVQSGPNAVVQSCTLQVYNMDTDTLVVHQELGGGGDRILVNVPAPTDTIGHFRVLLSTIGTGGGVDVRDVDYFVDATVPPPADPPSVTIHSPSWASAVNPGQALNLSSTCTAGSGASLTNCDAKIDHPDGSSTQTSGWNVSLPTSVPGDYGVTVIAKQDDGQQRTEYTWYRVNTPVDAVINRPTPGTVVNQGDTEPFDGGCVPGNSAVPVQNFTLIDPNGNVANFPGPNLISTELRGTYKILVHCEDANGNVDDAQTTYRVNAYPTVEITSPLDGLRVYTDTEVPAAYSCEDAEGPVASCTAPVAVGAHVDTNPAGPKSFLVTATDTDGAKASKTVSYHVYDKPTAHINGPAVDTVVNPGDPAPAFLGHCAGGVPGVTCTMTVTAPDGTVTPVASGDTLPIGAHGSYLLTVHVVDDFGTEQTAKRYYKVNEAPHVVVLTPLEGDTYFQGQDVTPSYSCYDNDHDADITEDAVVSCSGPAGPLATQDTPVGTHTYTVTAVDNDGASRSRTVSYKVVPVVGSCQGTGLQLLNTVFGRSGPADPCKTADGVVAKANAPLGSAAPSLLLSTGVTANVIEGHTVRTKPATFSARADVADATINILGTVTLKVTGVHSTAQSKLLSCSTAQLTGTSTVGTLVLNGVPVVVGNTPLSIPLVAGALHLNQRVTTATGITMRALFLDLPGTALDVVIGESSVSPRCGNLS